ncbi:hypothetical protein DBT_1132 [Dissulfuribacter thermophilus]|uniref:Uncharacterized protein n=1 Tax=Dissulfuribacter thermophilus TaxID=1156395 RepID=A0A1B9F6E5_9BACT|nr:hypothetical protein DBT_1132 [Dissulfuribacter thermophilus]
MMSILHSYLSPSKGERGPCERLPSMYFSAIPNIYFTRKVILMILGLEEKKAKIYYL